MQKVTQRKLRFFGHRPICRKNDDRKIETIMLGIMNGSNKKGRSHGEWCDDIGDWYGRCLQELYIAANRKDCDKT